MKIDRLNEVMARMEGLTIGVAGDLFLDLYLDLDRPLSEQSVETGLESYQAVNRRCQPGAAGNTAVNLAALGVGRIRAAGVIGEDGNGYDLLRALESSGVDCSAIVSATEILTPTYTKPLMRERDGSVRELNRIDIKNRSPLPESAERILMENVGAMIEELDGLVVIDQVQEADCGSITTRVREELIRLSESNPERYFLVDSRCRTGLFSNFILKPNLTEAMTALGLDEKMIDDCDALGLGRRIFGMRGRPVFITLGDRGCVVADSSGAEIVPAIPVEGEADPVGAGDTFMAAVAASLCAGASTREAAFIGNLAASIAVGKAGTTGAASPDELRGRLKEISSCG